MRGCRSCERGCVTCDGVAYFCGSWKGCSHARFKERLRYLSILFWSKQATVESVVPLAIFLDGFPNQSRWHRCRWCHFFLTSLNAVSQPNVNPQQSSKQCECSRFVLQRGSILMNTDNPTAKRHTKYKTIEEKMPDLFWGQSSRLPCCVFRFVYLHSRRWEPSIS